MSSTGNIKVTPEDIWKVPISISLLVVVHELLHAFAFYYWGNISFKDIRLGFNWKKFVAYCRCLAPVKIWMLRIILLLPLFFTVPIAFVVLLLYPSAWTVILISSTISVCMGDLLMIIELRRFDGYLLVKDHPSESLCEIFIPVHRDCDDREVKREGYP